MSKIVYKQRCNNPAKLDTPMLNVKHVQYIATRPGAVKNEGRSFGLFGKLDGMEQQGDIADLKETVKEIRGKSRQMTNIYRAIISMREDDALPMGFGKREAWEAMLNREIAAISREMAIPIYRMNYVASMHMEKGHPHVHIVFWDKQQGVKSYFTPPEKVDDIRKRLIKNIFANQFQDLYATKNQAAGTVKGGAVNVLDDLENALHSSHDMERARRNLAAISADYATGSLLSGRIAQRKLQDIAGQLLCVANAVPKTGRLNYQFMPPAVKILIDELAQSIIEMNIQCRQAMHTYLDTTLDIAKMYSEHPENHALMLDKAEAALMKSIGNRILDTVKAFNTLDAQQSNEQQPQESAFVLLCDIFSFLSRMTEQADAHRSLVRDELSKQAQVEWAIGHISKGLDWER